jgi:hypothetical protein
VIPFQLETSREERTSRRPRNSWVPSYRPTQKWGSTGVSCPVISRLGRGAEPGRLFSASRCGPRCESNDVMREREKAAEADVFRPEKSGNFACQQSREDQPRLTIAERAMAGVVRPACVQPPRVEFRHVKASQAFTPSFSKSKHGKCKLDKLPWPGGVSGRSLRPCLRIHRRGNAMEGQIAVLVPFVISDFSPQPVRRLKGIAILF